MIVQMTTCLTGLDLTKQVKLLGGSPGLVVMGGKRLTFQRSWVRFPAPYTGWTFFTFICCKNCKLCLKRPKINEKEAGIGPFFNTAVAN